MLESISTSKNRAKLLLLGMFAVHFLVSPAIAADNGGNGAMGSSPSAEHLPGPLLQEEEEDYKATPYMQYGEFNEEKEEEEELNFFQNGRFFGVSLGLGIETADGNRGTLWKGGFPLVDFKLHYWFDFNFALDLDFYYVQHNYNTGNTGAVNISLFRGGIDLKYYFDTKNIAAPISFANPYLIVGVGDYSETESGATITNSGTPNNSSNIGFAGGAGVEFAVKPRSTYITLEGKINVVTFDLDQTGEFTTYGLPDTTGNLYTFVASILFTW
jgi:opacity protein-like surface antigen